MRQAILDLLVHVTSAQQVDAGAAGAATMLMFTGEAEGPLFRGTVAPGGVDTQTVNAAGVRHMSARYILRGVALPPLEERPCAIFVENEAWFSVEGSPFRTVPRFLCDHPQLAQRLQGSIVGEGSEEADGLHIRFYQAE